MADTATEKVEDVAEEGKEKVTGNGNGSDSLKKILLPAAAGVGTLAAGYAAKKAPELFRDNVMPKIEDRGSDEAAKMGKQAMDKLKDSGGMAGKVAAVAGKLPGVGGGDDEGGGKKTRRLPIQRYTDVALPVDKVYEAWTDFEKFPNFMHRVQSVEKRGRDEIEWQEKIWFSKRQWKAKITERRKNDRIAWKTTSGTQHTGVISFHKLDDNLTRVMVTVDFHPAGILEKMGSGLRFAKRAVQADLARFKAYVELKDAKGVGYAAEKGKDDVGGDESESNGNGSSRSRNGNSKRSSEQSKDRRQRAERRKQRQA
jgi:uncharacterized membrane protein